MDIKIIKHQVSDALQKELDVYEADDFHRKVELDAIQTLDDLSQFLAKDPHFCELTHLFGKNAGSKPIKVLDIGVGVGLSSLLMAMHGYSVTAVEPSLTCCHILKRTAERLNLSIDIINSTAEELDEIDQKFDIGVYHSSLHHCDDPVMALKKTRARLNTNGKLFLVGEPLLRCYRTKKWFYRMLEEQPEFMGHYGGNEHIYRLQEYVGFLKKAGFSKVKIIPSVVYSQKPEKWIGDTPRRYFIKERYYKVMNFILNKNNLFTRAISSILIQLSLIYVTFEATD